MTTVILSSIHYMGILAMATSLVMFFIHPTPIATRVFLATLVFTCFTWIIAFFKRRSTHCALCKGTPLIESGALAHQKATRIFPFNYGVSATLSIIATQKFRCMYCGTEFDLLKPSSHSSKYTDVKYESDYTADKSDETD